MIALRDVVARVGELSPLPPTVGRLAQVVADKRSTVDDVVGAVSYDQALTAEVLRMANSVESASARTIATVRDAVIRLGGARILERVVGRHVHGDMSTSITAYGYSEDDLFRHSVASAVATELLGSHARVPADGLAFTAALLHDIGKLLLGRTAPAADMEEVWRTIRQGSCTCDEAERRVLGFTHAEVGADVASAWKLPQLIVEAIRLHHAVESEGNSVVDAVRVANLVARSIGEGIGNEGMSIAMDSQTAGRLGLTREGLERLCAATSRRLKGILALYEISGSEKR
jgi:putative nucleotidyltransferase with HDIG domain